MKYAMTILFAAAALAAAVPVRAALPARAAACAAQDMQLFYYYLSPVREAKVKDYPTDCHPGLASLKMPDWLDKAMPSMTARKVWKDPEEGELSEAVLWQTAASILYEFADKTAKAEEPLKLEAEYNDIRVRFMMGLDRLHKAGLETSFEGRGARMLGALDALMRDFDGLTEALSDADRKGFDRKAAGLLERSRGLFTLLFEPPGKEAGAKPASRYTPEARILPGYRGVSLPLSGSQALFVEKGDRVDMLVTFDAVMAGDAREKVTATILQNVLVTAVRKPAAGEPGVVQLLCNPNEAQYAALSLAQAGNINLVRRAPGDMELRPMEIASFGKLFK
ncbi:MAG: RcpC/CpaB family pilus assembly protein [Elusimicrobiales bacterium]